MLKIHSPHFRLQRSHVTSLILFLSIGTALSLLGCSSPGDIRTPANSVTDNLNGSFQTCAAIRGNGDRIFSTLSGLAAYTENYGLFDAVSGASSGGVATFFYESMRLNPELHICETGPCDEQTVWRRMGLMLKSFQGYADFLVNDTEIRSILNLKGLFEKISSQIDKKGILRTLASGEVREAAKNLHDILSSKLIVGLLNREILSMLKIKNIPALKKNIQRIIASAKSGSSLSERGSEVNLKTGLLDMNAFAKYLGRIANFYAGYGPVDRKAWQRFFQHCSEPSFDKTWPELLESSRCGKEYKLLLRTYRTKLVAQEPISPSRDTDIIGATPQVATFLSSAVIIGSNNVQAFTQARADYMRGAPANFDPSIKDFRIGYWGNNTQLRVIEQNRNGYQDFKTTRFMGLGSVPWRKALYHSISEPGFSHLIPDGNDKLTAGGWVDAHSTLLLKNLGCARVVYFTRYGEDSSFAIDVSTTMGFTEKEKKELFSVRHEVPKGDGMSSLELSVTESSAIWCTNWMEYSSIAQMKELVTDGFRSPMQVNDPFFLKESFKYKGAKMDTGLLGCQVKR